MSRLVYFFGRPDKVYGMIALSYIFVKNLTVANTGQTKLQMANQYTLQIR